jgi:hypothetical protein
MVWSAVPMSSIAILASGEGADGVSPEMRERVERLRRLLEEGERGAAAAMILSRRRA